MCEMRVQRIQQQNYYQSKITPNINQQNSKVTFEALKLKKDVFNNTKKSNQPLFLKMGALVGAFAVAVKELFFNKVLDISTVNQIKQDAIVFGEKVAESIYLNDGKFKQEAVEKLVLAHLDEENAKNVQVVTGEKGFCDFAEENMKLNREFAKSVFDKAEGLVAQGKNGKIILLLKLEGEEPEIATHIAAHEFEHLLYKTEGFMGKLIKKYLAEESPKEEKENVLISAESENKKFFKMQSEMTSLLVGADGIGTPFQYVEYSPTIEGVIEVSPELSSKEDLDMRLRSCVQKELLNSCDEDTIFAELQAFQIVLRDEARAYEVGGKSQRYYDSLAGKGRGKSTRAEMVAVIYNQMADIIQEYKTQIIKNSLRKSLGLKPKELGWLVPDKSVSVENNQIK